MSLQATPSQTVGPYFHIGFNWLYVAEIAPVGVSGARVEVEGRVIDGDDKPIDDAVIEIWQANAHGKYAHPEDRQDKPLEPGFRGFGRVRTDAQGRFRFSTIKPGRVTDHDGSVQAPHLAISIFARGVTKRLATRLYFPEEEAANADDLALQLVPAARRRTLIAERLPGSDRSLQWVVKIQGTGETVFFDV